MLDSNYARRSLARNLGRVVTVYERKYPMELKEIAELKRLRAELYALIPSTFDFISFEHKANELLGYLKKQEAGHHGPIYE